MPSLRKKNRVRYLRRIRWRTLGTVADDGEVGGLFYRLQRFYMVWAGLLLGELRRTIIYDRRLSPHHLRCDGYSTDFPVDSPISSC